MIPWIKSEIERVGPVLEKFDFGKTDLEEELFGSHAEERRQCVVERFDALYATLNKQMASGVPPGLFQEYKTIREALTRATKIVAALR